MNVSEFLNRLDDGVNALERIAISLEKIADKGVTVRVTHDVRTALRAYTKETNK